MTATLIKHRHGGRMKDEFETVEGALKAAYWGEEGGFISAEKVTDSDGEVVWDTDDVNIFDYCEGEGYDWVAEYMAGT